MQRLKRRIIIKTLGLAGVLSLLLLCFQKNFVALGVLVGAFVGITCFHLLARHILASTSLGLQKVKPYFFLQYLIRYAIIGIILFISSKIGLNFFFGTAIGLLLIYVVIFLDTLILNKECKIQAK